MIVPTSRLLWAVAWVVLPFATVAALSPDSLLMAGLLIGILMACALLDAVLAFGSLDEVMIELPPVVRLSKDREGAVEILVRNPARRERLVRLGLPFPREFRLPQEDLLAALPAREELSRVTWKCTPSRRGNYMLDKCYLEGASPWGLWAVRAARAVQCELRVYPNLMTERRNVAALFLSRGNFGIHALRQVGKGRDFEKLREYIPGDSYDDVHWKATAKRGHPVTKVFQVERTQEVYVIIDASRLSARETVKPGKPVAVSAGAPEAEAPVEEATVLERFITSALVLGFAAEQQGDLFGLVTFSDRVHKFVRAKSGQSHYAACRDALYTLHPRTVTPDFDELCSFIRLRLRRRALLVFLTALDDPVLAESFVRNLDLIHRQHLILVNMVEPAGAKPLFSNANVQTTDDIYRELGGHVRWHNLRELDKVLQRRGIKFSLLENERLSAQLVTQYLNVKRRQLL
ncbi:MAG: DUF58 domain-containing protein [Verrucomicrobiota bacterium]